MEKVTEHLYCTSPDFPFGDNTWKTCACLLCRKDGNLIVYSSSKFKEEETQLRELGGVTHHYLNHRDEATGHSDWITETFDAPLVCSEKDREEISQKCIVGDTISKRTQIFSDFEAIPTPGHSTGSTCYLWEAPDARYLFTGDSIYLNNDKWQVYLAYGSLEDMLSSLEIIAGLDFDVLVPGTYVGENRRMRTTPEKTRQNINEIISRIKNGESM